MSAFTSFIRPAVTAFVIPVAGCVTRDLAAVTPPLARGGYDTIAVVADAADPVAWRARGVSRVVHVSGPDSSSDSCIAAALLACRARGHPPGRVALLLDGDVSTPWPWSFSRGELVKSATRAGSQAVLLASPVPADLPPYTSATGPMIGLPSASLVDAVAGLVSGVHEGSPPYAFGPHGVPADHVFASSAHAYALVNLKPVTAGHALIVSRRAVPRFRDLAPAEVADLWSLAQAISAGLEARFDADAATIVLQDGAAAGQTVAHVHVHVLPRHVADLADNDEVYELIEESSAALQQRALAAPAAPQPARSHALAVDPLGPDQSRRPGRPLAVPLVREPRSHEAMAAEAAEFRALFGDLQERPEERLPEGAPPAASSACAEGEG